MQILSSRVCHKVLFETSTAGCRCSFCMSIPILEHGLEVFVHSLVFTVCRQPQGSELEMCKVHDAISQVCHWKQGHWMRNTRGCVLIFFHTHADAVYSRTTLERLLEPEPRLGESASSQQAFPHFLMNQRVIHADCVRIHFSPQSTLSNTGTAGCKCSFCISLPILEHGLEVSVHSLVSTVCRQPQVSELEMCKVHDARSQVCYWKQCHWMPNTLRVCPDFCFTHTQMQSTVVPL